MPGSTSHRIHLLAIALNPETHLEFLKSQSGYEQVRDQQVRFTESSHHLFVTSSKVTNGSRGNSFKTRALWNGRDD
jgi:hypothetical protein